MSAMTAKPGRAARAYLAEIGRKGGLAKSARKTDACRANAKRPRPGRRKKLLDTP